MMWEELYESEEKTIEERHALSRQIDGHQRQIDMRRGEEHFKKHVLDLTNEGKQRDNQLLAIESERHMRFALRSAAFASPWWVARSASGFARPIT